MMRKRAVAALLSGLLLTGCSGGSDDGAGSPGEATPTSGQDETSAGGQGQDAAFGESFEFDDGLAIQVSAPKPFSPSANATKGGEPDFVRMSIRLVNGAERKIALDRVSVTVESGGGQAGDVIDTKKGLTGGPPSKVVRPGGKATWALGFGVIDPEDVTVQVQVGMERTPVTIGR